MISTPTTASIRNGFFTSDGSMIRYCYLLLFLAACGTPASTDEDDVRRQAEGIIAADNRADLDGVMRYYAENAILIPPGAPDIQGHVAIRAHYQKIFESSVPRLTITIDEISVSGTQAVCRGGTGGEVLIKGDSTVKIVNDKFLMVLEKTDDWRITHLIWNR